MKLPELTLRNLFWLVALAALAPPTSVCAQWADTRCEHDWTLTVGEQTFGLRQQVHLPGERRTTTICLGSKLVESELRAFPLAAIIILPMGILGIAVVAAIGSWTRKNE